MMFKNALISVSDKAGLADFIRPLASQGTRLLSTGKTAQYLRDHGLKVTDVSEQTQFPEVMSGRVKTLHPYIHMSLLARSEDMKLLEKHHLAPFDLVVGNLYPFEKAVREDLERQKMVELIDIGGPSLLRAAAKNFERVCVICDPCDYSWVCKKKLTLEDRQYLASKVFYHTSSYDCLIAQTLCRKSLPKEFSLAGRQVCELRYGENPQQSAAWYQTAGTSQGLHKAQLLQGKALSYNNLLDLDAATSLLTEFSTPCCVAVKHNNPCGVGLGEKALTAIERSLKADPVSVFGGIVAINQKISEREAEKLTRLFLECVVAPDYTQEALEIFKKKKNLRLLQWTPQPPTQGLSVKTLQGGFLLQPLDRFEEVKNWEFMGKKPDPQMMKTLVFSWKVAMKLKSNGIAIAQPNQTVGLGMGQVNRVDAVSQAIGRMKQFHSSAKKVCLASDAFFPFADSIEVAALAGIKWIIQPGGSIKDSEVLDRAKQLGVNMVLTRTRHFLH